MRRQKKDGSSAASSASKSHTSSSGGGDGGPQQQQQFRKLEHREHVLVRPGMYIGSIEVEETPMFVLDREEGRMKLIERLKYCPGLAKIFDEIVVNAIDHVTRMRQAGEKTAPAAEVLQQVQRVKKIEISIDRETGVLEVLNDGEGIPVEMSEEAGGVYVPELIFGHMLTGSNFDDGEADRIIGGQNGIGAKACNIFSQWFEVETLDRKNGRLYKQRFDKNMSIIRPPVIKASSLKRAYTRIRFLPDYERFGYADGRLTDDMYAVFERRSYDATAVTDADVAVTLNSTKIDVKTFERYIDLYIGDKSRPRVHEKLAADWEVAVALSDGTGLRQVSFVNGIATLRGGKHVDHVVNLVSKKLGEFISSSKSSSRQTVNIKPQFIRDNLFVFVKAVVPNPTFDSQSKETLTTPVAKFGAKIDVSDKFIEKLAKLDGLVERVLTLSDSLSQSKLSKTDGTKRSTLYGIPKLEDAEWAGTAKSQQCTLILTEGDSAKASALAGLAVVGRQRWGVYPLRGKIMNVCDVSADRVAANAEISALKKILGLQSGKAYASTADLRYGRLMLMTDADHDGSHIRGLLFNLFYQQWPSLLKIEGFLAAMLTPVVKAWPPPVSTQSKKKKPSSSSPSSLVAFYNARDYEEWARRMGPDALRGYRTKYYKGLGTSTAEEAREWFKNMRIAVYTWTEDETPRALDLGFDKKRADERKTWLQAYDPQRTLDYGRQDVPYQDFVNRELIHFSQYDLQRSIPSVIDGLKVSMRKVLFGCFKRKNLETDEVRVAQLAAYVSEQSAFHHGEASMQGTIIGMAQAFVGANNVPLLHGVGQFGSRLCGGSDAASPRYIYAKLPPSTRLIFPKEDDAILKYLEDDGTLVEPEHYVPIIPMLLVNGAVGIGTGYSTNVPCHDPMEVIAVLKARLEGRCPPLPGMLGLPWYRGFKGAVQASSPEDTRKVTSRGCMTRISPKELRITELPIGYWTEDFKGNVENFVEKNADVKSYSNASTNTAVSMTLKFATAAALDAWLAPSSASSPTTSKIEAELKLVSNKGLSMTNMHAFDARGVIKKYESTADIIDDFYAVRMEAYVRRKTAQLAALDREIKIAEFKVRFLNLILEKELDLQRTSSDELTEKLLQMDFEKIDGSFQFLTGMAISSMTRDRRDALVRFLETTRQSRHDLAETTESQLWLRDLDRLALALSNHEEEEQDNDDDDDTKEVDDASSSSS